MKESMIDDELWNFVLEIKIIVNACDQEKIFRSFYRMVSLTSTQFFFFAFSNFIVHSSLEIFVCLFCLLSFFFTIRSYDHCDRKEIMIQIYLLQIFTDQKSQVLLKSSKSSNVYKNWFKPTIITTTRKKIIWYILTNCEKKEKLFHYCKFKVYFLQKSNSYIIINNNNNNHIAIIIACNFNHQIDNNYLNHNPYLRYVIFIYLIYLTKYIFLGLFLPFYSLFLTLFHLYFVKNILLLYKIK